MGIWAALIPAGLWALDKIIEGGVSGSGSYDKAAGDMMAGMNKGLDTVNKASEKAFGFIQPYQEGGQQDYQQLRNLFNTGYFNQQAPVSFTGGQMPTPSFRMGPGVQSFGHTPWNPGAQRTFAPLQLPGMPAMPPPQAGPAPAPVAPQGPQNGKPTPGPNIEAIMKALEKTLLQMPTPMVNNPVAPPDPRKTILPDTMKGPITIAEMYQRLGRGSGPFNPMPRMPVGNPYDPSGRMG